jgi:phage gp46-like protein
VVSKHVDKSNKNWGDKITAGDLGSIKWVLCKYKSEVQVNCQITLPREVAGNDWT